MAVGFKHVLATAEALLTRKLPPELLLVRSASIRYF